MSFTLPINYDTIFINELETNTDRIHPTRENII